MITIRAATPADAEQIAQLERQHINAELDSTEVAMSGQHFSQSDILTLITQHWVAVAVHQSQIVGYVFAGRWGFFDKWPIYRFLSQRIDQYQVGSLCLSQRNSCQYGPIWISDSFRQQGIFKRLVSQLMSQIPAELSAAVTFIAESNQHSYSAHTHGAGMQVLDFFDFDDRDYYLLAIKTR
ncbi:GNAT family N-acetyltransferase [Shewanella waksmanii]|uniref:GNAT family N-acetyltransferase n=1 Tax=Shewanella waksmanii TaxID=213783 RepID=UPI003734EC1A